MANKIQERAQASGAAEGAGLSRRMMLGSSATLAAGTPLPAGPVTESGEFLTANHGIRISNDQKLLKVGARGRVLLEDFLLREKINYFGHERIPERVVHARGTMAHGYFELTASLADGSKAAIFKRVGKRTPLSTRRTYDAPVVDRMLPGLGGLSVIAALRLSGVRAPALILSAHSDLDKRVHGLHPGGDDDLPKPFARTELAARLEALLRRPMAAHETVLRAGLLMLERQDRTATRNGRDLELLPRELLLLEYMVRRPGQVVTRSTLLPDVWGYRFEPRGDVVVSYMGKLRRKVDPPESPPLSSALRGAGYRLNASV